MTDWQPIEAAPNDGTEILACSTWIHADGGLRFNWIADGYLDENSEWVFASFPIDEDEYTKPTHWMPLPAPPPLT